jgi:hypothetical protein
MATFKSIKELEKYIASQQGSNSVLSDNNIRKILTQEARRLERYMKEELQSYFNSYEPTVYKRTGDTVRSIEVKEPRKLGLNSWGIEIGFDEDLANHDSYIGDNQPQGYTPWLLEVGWDIRDKIPYDAPMFTHHDGTQYISKAVERFNRSNPHGMVITVYKDGKKYI